MQGDDLLTESHSDAGSALLAGSGLIHHIKSLRDPRDLFLWDPPAVVYNLDLIALCEFPSLHQDKSAFFHSLYGIIQQII